MHTGRLTGFSGGAALGFQAGLWWVAGKGVGRLWAGTSAGFRSRGISEHARRQRVHVDEGVARRAAIKRFTRPTVTVNLILCMSSEGALRH